eukprot:3813199-Rhodomonas_salina.1
MKDGSCPALCPVLTSPVAAPVLLAKRMPEEFRAHQDASTLLSAPERMRGTHVPDGATGCDGQPVLLRHGEACTLFAQQPPLSCTNRLQLAWLTASLVVKSCRIVAQRSIAPELSVWFQRAKRARESAHGKRYSVILLDVLFARVCRLRAHTAQALRQDQPVPSSCNPSAPAPASCTLPCQRMLVRLAGVVLFVPTRARLVSSGCAWSPGVSDVGFRGLDMSCSAMQGLTCWYGPASAKDADWTAHHSAGKPELIAGSEG